jgi:hypothetical protein
MVRIRRDSFRGHGDDTGNWLQEIAPSSSPSLICQAAEKTSRGIAVCASSGLSASECHDAKKTD